MLQIAKPSMEKSTLKAGMVIILGPLLVIAFVMFVRSATSHHIQKVEAQTQAQPDQTYLSPTQTLAHCIVSASTLYQVPTDVILGIVSVEGGHVGQTAGPNSNGTYDLGLMQINSLWVPQLAKMWQIDYGSAYAALRDSGCENIYVGTWILKHKIAETGSLYNGIAYYHSATRVPGNAYADRVVAAMSRNSMASR